MKNQTSRLLHPKLRLLANGSESVNAQRSSSSYCVASFPPPGTDEGKAFASIAMASVEAFATGAIDSAALPIRRQAVKRQKLEQAGEANSAFVNVFIETRQADGVDDNPAFEIAAKVEDLVSGAGMSGNIVVRRNFISATVPIAKLDAVSAISGVSFVHSADALVFKLPVADLKTEVAKPTPRAVTVGDARQTGEGVIVGIIDVGGFDFAHPDFLNDAGETRFISIWDQGGDSRDPPAGFDYGAYLTGSRLNAALRLQKDKGLPATLIEKQSQSTPGSHGTHVASIAAGNSGVCPKALIAGVLVSLPSPENEREARRWTFSDSSRIVHAIEHLLKVAADLGMPISINISLGTNGGPHDGSNGPCRWIDSALSNSGRAICIAAGNAGQEKATAKDDLGWIMGRIHTSGRVPSRGLDIDLDWVVVGDGIADVSENELEIWYGAQDRITVSVLPPGATEWLTVGPREFIENKRVKSGSMLSIYNELYHPTNGDNYIAIYLSPHWNLDAYTPVTPGTWKVRLHGDEIRDGRFHAWIERDDPMEVERRKEMAAFRFPSFFSEASNVDSHSLGSLGCAHRVVAVANTDTQANAINVTSSQGPTRDGRNKPDIAAPGTAIVAACGFTDDTQWVPMTGTSMASPYVCGVIGLMLAAKPNLNAAQCLGILRRTARPLPSHTYEWRNDAGYGTLNAEAAIEEAKVFDQRKER